MSSLWYVRSTPDDRSTPAVIRDEALRLFAERGPEAVTVRDVAAAAGVSPGLVIHHFGSKAALRRAVEEHVVGAVEGVLELARSVEGPASLAGQVVAALPDGSPIPGYLRRLVMSGDPAGMRIFAQWFELAGRSAGAGEGGPEGTADDERQRAAVRVIGDLGVLLLREQLSVVLGVDPLGSAGRARWSAVTRP
jgi:AcrR family transcriptional regulator